VIPFNVFLEKTFPNNPFVLEEIQARYSKQAESNWAKLGYCW
jgi:hypothetical protein